MQKELTQNSKTPSQYSRGSLYTSILLYDIVTFFHFIVHGGFFKCQNLFIRLNIHNPFVVRAKNSTYSCH